MAARGRAYNSVPTKHYWNYSFSLHTVIRVAVFLLIGLGLLLYICIFISPAVLRQVLLAVDLCNENEHHTKAATTASNVMLSSPKFGNALDAPDTNLEMKQDYDSRIDFKELPKLMDADPHRGLNLGSTKQRITVQERRIGESSYGNPKRFTILIGVLTMASKIDRRNLLRLAYAVQSSPDAHVSVRFVIGGFEGGGGVEKTLVGMENATYGDIIVLNCPENLNEGKTFTFFSSLPDRGVEYDFVMKTDDDSYIRFENLAKSLKRLPRTDLYYGYILPCENEDPYSWYMAGMGYLISWDLVLWIRDSSIPRNKSVGTEDQLVGEWFDEGGVAKNRVNEKPLIYDHPEFGGNCAHELVMETILVHQVKTPERWADVLGFFEKDRIARALSL